MPIFSNPRSLSPCPFIFTRRLSPPSLLIVSSSFFLESYPHLGGATSCFVALPFACVFTPCIVLAWGLSGSGAG